MPKRTTISDARRRLFDLVDWVLDNPDGVVYIEHRDRAARVALVREDRLAYLERRERATEPPATLVGSVSLVGNATVEQIVADVRAEAASGAARRLRELSGEHPAFDG
jgi:hypothetical protein